MSKDQHVDDFIDHGVPGERGQEDHNTSYARWVLAQFRFPASLAMATGKFIRRNKLFCTFRDEKYRVTGASRMGDIWLTKDFNQHTGYQTRVNVSDCSNWRQD